MGDWENKTSYKKKKVKDRDKNKFVYIIIMKLATKTAPGPMGDWERTTLAGRTRLSINSKLFILLLFKGVFEFWTSDLTIIISLNYIIIKL